MQRERIIKNEHRHVRWLTMALLVLSSMLPQRVFASDFLDPDQAFKLKATLTDSNMVVLDWDIANGCKLYRDRITVNVGSGSATLQEPVLPKGATITDEVTGEALEIYHDHLKVVVPIVSADAPFRLDVAYQGCADAGLCYPPLTRMYLVEQGRPGLLAESVDDGGTGDPSESAASSEQAPAIAGGASSGSDDMSLAKATLEGGSLWKIGLAFLVFGLLLSFTPCVLPMVPILSSIIVGEGTVSRRHGFLMAVAYCLGMAFVYTSLGVAAGLAGEGLAGALQKPWVLVTFAALLVLLSLSMFDVYQLQMPQSLQTKLGRASDCLKGGRFAGVFVMGSLSALIVGPCVAAPLAGTLVYISQTGNVVLGGLALFAMAMGMSLPLLLVGLSAGALLPKAGAWMISVKYLFGLMLIAVAIWMVTPVLPPTVIMVVWGAFAILCAVFLGVFGAMPEKPSIGRRFSKALGVVLIVIGVMELFGAASGGERPLEPLSEIRPARASVGIRESKPLFRRITSVAELDEVLRSADQPLMLDFYADWCVACKEMDRFTFHDPAVMNRLQDFTLLQVNVTANTLEDRALMKRFSLFGPPGIIFFDRFGHELPDRRIVGVMDAPAFLQHLQGIMKP
ncbi:protein-disulfide reductase DsbD [Pelodictyon luteolum]|uniref:Thiol:disulfide interchange protein DsbD n=1 Tax=Chlorobium luteolum (strain DSM 273 / BCRC 81028 / 2530) TaxID=319225 RepID=Q3B2K9_CHLL3|nr:protein-disulfide reductase DsbD [Pelodictyon luteolum]ABB24422.1 Protein-disulfide reductase [Pelodictyon luteolum DSM 273]